TAAGAAANFMNPTALNNFWSGINDDSSLYAANPGMTSLFGLHDPTFYFAVYDNGRAFADTIALGQASRFRVPIEIVAPDAGEAFANDVADTAKSVVTEKLLDKAEAFLADQIA